jgi:hypothetical protein
MKTIPKKYFTREACVDVSSAALINAFRYPPFRAKMLRLISLVVYPTIPCSNKFHIPNNNLLDKIWMHKDRKNLYGRQYSAYSDFLQFPETLNLDTFSYFRTLLHNQLSEVFGAIILNPLIINHRGLEKKTHHPFG